jgi:hypothetical protein
LFLVALNPGDVVVRQITPSFPNLALKLMPIAFDRSQFIDVLLVRNAAAAAID